MYNLVIPKLLWTTGEIDAPAVPTLARLFNRLETDTVIQIVNDDATPDCIISMLASHPEVKVRCAVAAHTRTPSSIFLRLAMDDSADVRYELAENQSVPISVLLILAEDTNPYIRNRATWTIAGLEAQALTG